MEIAENIKDMGRLELSLAQMSYMLKSRRIREVVRDTKINHVTLSAIRDGVINGDEVTITLADGREKTTKISPETKRKLNDYLTTLQ